jgi:uncharacterized protein (DUF1786 family)
MASGFWRAVLLHCRKFLAHQEMRPPDFRRMNSALKKIRHQPLAKASGMDRAVKQLLTRLT